ncbi:glycosyltransferase family 1 protein [Virgibacillus litoralis]|uniref:Glycosyltransferase involved in cell wall biosynthesis n=1 Tax=Virgibacillus litoralis TaxID=578221 RepID=A0ABS4HDS2_9BACI|nr:glycosyltransferase family 1 protein [Virgibacillus litoralis]MBP1949065.1 glycosyltransferase involved in cell wall biosynthesis [Virgibacillus litoralis]
MGSPLRVLHVVVNMNRGGAETLIMNLYRNIDRSKVQFDFLTCKEGVFDSEIIRMGGKIHRIPYVTEAGHKGFNRALNQFLKTHYEYKIVHSHMDKMSGFVLKAAKKANIPVRIAHSHNTESEGGITSRTYKWYAGSKINAHATHYYACSHAAARWLFKNKSEEAFILKNGIETEKFKFSQQNRNAIRRELNLDKGTLVIGNVGRMAPQKNQLQLLDIFAGLNKQIVNSVLLIAGEGPLKKEIEAKIEALNLSGKVKLLGVRDDIESILQAIDIFVFPSMHEGLPVTLVEAQGAGLPCLIADTITREVDMGSGLVEHLPLRDTDSWIKRIISLEKQIRPRIIDYHSLSKNGYDIKETAEQTQASYLVLGEAAI